jgi:hypothetical protein
MTPGARVPEDQAPSPIQKTDCHDEPFGDRRAEAGCFIQLEENPRPSGAWTGHPRDMRRVSLRLRLDDF